ncbi:MAG: hypothetical protein IKS03_06140 [Ruminococcus sp.]|nr:hypothetical protein [Ruminococcus sp.]
MKNRVFAAAIIAVLSVSLASCGVKSAVGEPPVDETSSSVDETPTEDSEAEELLTAAPLEDSTEPETEAEITEPVTEAKKAITMLGEEKEGDLVHKVALTNSTGKNISEFAVKADFEAVYPQNMIPGDSVFTSDANPVTLVYESPEIPPEEIFYYDGVTPTITTEYSIKLIFDDGTKAELHSFPFNDCYEAKIMFEDDVAFVEYTSLYAGSLVNTKESELMIKSVNGGVSFADEPSAPVPDAGNAVTEPTTAAEEDLPTSQKGTTYVAGADLQKNQNQNQNGANGGYIDPNTGLYVDPNNAEGGYIDPNTGLWVDTSGASGGYIDPNTGLWVDPNNGYGYDQSYDYGYDQSYDYGYDPNAGYYY